MGGDATGLGGACGTRLDQIGSRHADGRPHRHDAIRPNHEHTPDDALAAHDNCEPHHDLDPRDDADDDSDDDADDHDGAHDDGPDRHDADHDGGGRDDDDYGGAVGR